MAASFEERMGALRQRISDSRARAHGLFDALPAEIPNSLNEMLKRIQVTAHSVQYSPADEPSTQAGLPQLVGAKNQLA